MKRGAVLLYVVQIEWLDNFFEFSVVSIIFSISWKLRLHFPKYLFVATGEQKAGVACLFS